MQPIVKLFDGALPADPDGIATAQTLASAGDVTLDGVFCTGGVAYMTPNSCINIFSVGDDSGITFTVTGKDQYGTAQSEVLEGTSGGFAESGLFYSEISQIEASGATAGDITVGNFGNTTTKMVALDPYCDPMTYYQVSVQEGSSLTYTVQGTLDNPNDPVNPCPTPNMVWFNAAGSLISQSITQFSQDDFTPLYVRLRIEGEGQVRFTVVQYGSVNK